MTEKPLFFGNEASNRLFQNCIDLFINPEIEKRQNMGEITRFEEITKAQIIFFADNKERIVRLNDEVRAIIEIKLKDGIQKEKGEDILANEVEAIYSAKIPDETYSDCAYIIMIKYGDNWYISFDFRYNKALSKGYIEKANEFIECASFGLSQNYLGATIDNLFGAIELISKAILLVSPTSKMMDKTNHCVIKNSFNYFIHVGNLSKDYSKTYNKLSKLRSKARYSSEKLEIPKDELKEITYSVKSLKKEAEKMTRVR